MAKSTEIAYEEIVAIKRKTKRSWLQLRRRWKDLMGETASTPLAWWVLPLVRSLGKSYREIVKWLDKQHLGIE